MIIELVAPSVIRLWGPFPDLKAWRDDVARFRPGAQFSNAFRKGDWDGKTRPGKYRKVDGAWCLDLPRGYLDRVRASFPDAPVYEEHPPSPDIEPRIPEGARDYQARSLRLIAERRWGQVGLATNAGKGAIIALAAEAARGHGVLVLADEVSVFDALREQIAEWSPDLDVGVVAAGADSPPEERVCVAMVQTLHNRLYERVTEGAGKKRHRYVPRGDEWDEWARGIGMVLLDEADRATSNNWRRVLKALPNTEWRVGFSGSFPDPETAVDEEGRQEAEHAQLVIEGIMGPPLIRVRNRTLVSRGISARPLVELVPHDAPTPDWRDLEGMTGPEARRAVYERAVVRNPFRHELVRSLLDEGEPNVVIVNLIEHGERLRDHIPGSVFLHGSSADREGMLRAFREGEFDTLIATRVLQRGTNLLGRAVGLIMASGEGSSREVLQYVGRGLRRAGGKDFVYVRDVIDRGHRYLDRASRKRVEVYRDEGFDMEVRR